MANIGASAATHSDDADANICRPRESVAVAVQDITAGEGSMIPVYGVRRAVSVAVANADISTRSRASMVPLEYPNAIARTPRFTCSEADAVARA
jgi:hypothetical protein